jgi:hypothetical protein
MPLLGNQADLGLKHSDWVETVYPEPLLSIQKIYFRMLAFNDVSKRLKGGTVCDLLVQRTNEDRLRINFLFTGPLIEHMSQSMLKKRYNDTAETSRQVFQIYSGHDSTLATFLNTLGVYDDIPPPYSAAVFIELRYMSGNYFVTVSLNGTIQNKTFLLPTFYNGLSTREISLKNKTHKI